MSRAAIWFAVARPHILTIVYFSTLTYVWIFTGAHDFVLPFVAVWDWFIVNFANKAVDVDEDEKNGIVGASVVREKKRVVEMLCFAMIGVGLLGGTFLYPALLPYRVLFTVIGLAYNYRLIPWFVNGRLGRTRFKEMYFFKNFGSSMLFTLSVFVYPRMGLPAAADFPDFNLAVAILFFIPLELTYEIIYDLRDVDGDRAEGVPTYPVVHGVKTAKRIIYGLIAFAAMAPLVASTTLPFREWCVVVACVQQLVLMRIYCAGDRRPTQRDSVLITMMGAAQLASYNLWVGLGLPL